MLIKKQFKMIQVVHLELLYMNYRRVNAINRHNILKSCIMKIRSRLNINIELQDKKKKKTEKRKHIKTTSLNHYITYIIRRFFFFFFWYFAEQYFVVKLNVYEFLREHLSITRGNEYNNKQPMNQPDPRS